MKNLRNQGRSAGLLVTVLIGVLLLVSCVTPMRVVVKPVLTQMPASAQTMCTDLGGSVACLTMGQPAYRVTFGPDEQVQWIKLSPNGATLLASVAPLNTKRSWQSLFVAIDTASKSERWRIHLAENPYSGFGAQNCEFVGSDKVALHTTNSLLIVLDLNTGAEVWRHVATEMVYDPLGRVFLGKELQAKIMCMVAIDADTGQVVDSIPSSDLWASMQISGGPAHFTETDGYLYDAGLVRWARRERRFLWGRGFATYATDSHKTVNTVIGVGNVITSFLNVLSALGGKPTTQTQTESIPPDRLFGRTAEPLITPERVVAAAQSFVHGLDPATGKLIWSKDLETQKIARIQVKGDRVYILAGGDFIFWEGRTGLVVKPTFRYGIYCLNLRDGNPVPSFCTPFNENVVVRSLSTNEIDSINDDSSWGLEKHWPTKPGENKAAKERTPDTLGVSKRPAAFSWKRIVGMNLIDAGLLVATSDEVLLLDAQSGNELKRISLKDLGEAVALTPLPQVTIIRTQGGFAGVANATGKLAWSRKQDGPVDLKWTLPPGHEPFLRMLPAGALPNLELTHFYRSVYWIDRPSETLLALTSDSYLVALNVRDGSVKWEMPLPFLQVRLEVGADRSLVYLVKGPVAQVFRLPRDVGFVDNPVEASGKFKTPGITKNNQNKIARIAKYQEVSKVREDDEAKPADQTKPIAKTDKTIKKKSKFPWLIVGGLAAVVAKTKDKEESPVPEDDNVNLADQAKLAEVAKNDKDGSVRLAAAAKLNDKSLAQVIYASIAKYDKDGAVREAAVEKLTDQALLANLAKYSKYNTVRETAEKRIQELKKK